MKKVIIGILIVILAVLIIGYFVKNRPVDQNVQQEKVIMQEQFTGDGMLRDVIGISYPARCEMSVVSDGVQAQATAYVVPGKIHVDYVFSDQSTATLVRSGETMYAWTNDTARKADIATLQTGPIKIPTTNPALAVHPIQVATNLNQRVNYDCKKWSEDSKMFDIPSDKVFN